MGVLALLQKRHVGRHCLLTGISWPSPQNVARWDYEIRLAGWERLGGPQDLSNHTRRGSGGSPHPPPPDATLGRKVDFVKAQTYKISKRDDASLNSSSVRWLHMRASWHPVPCPHVCERVAARPGSGAAQQHARGPPGGLQAVGAPQMPRAAPPAAGGPGGFPRRLQMCLQVRHVLIGTSSPSPLVGRMACDWLPSPATQPFCRDTVAGMKLSPRFTGRVCF